MKKIAIAVSLGFIVAFSASLFAQSPIDGFDPNADDVVYCTAVQPDGKIIIGGVFTTILGTTRSKIARLNPDGSLDMDFNPIADNAVKCIAIQSDGKILIGGWFTTVCGTARDHLARLNPDGSLDATFNPIVYYPSSLAAVYCIAVQGDGKIIIGGWFSAVNGVARNYVARINADGNLDTTFDPNANAAVYCINIQSDDKILIGGSYTSIGGSAIKRLARFNSDGTIDIAFNPNPEDVVLSIAFQPDGKMVIGGGFTDIDGITRNKIARLYSNGSLDLSFDPNVNTDVETVVLQPDGKILIGGTFWIVGGLTRNNIARLYPDGSLDPAFDPNTGGATNDCQSISMQSDGKIVIGGSFHTVSGTTRNHIARLYPDGSLDKTIDQNANNFVHSTVIQPDGKILIGGQFIAIGGTTRNYIARLNVDGSLDTTFNPDADSSIYSIAVQPDGKIIIGGCFTAIGGTTRNRIARLNGDGSLDTSFNSSVNGCVMSIVVQIDNKILIGGQFSFVGGAERNYIARLNSDGGLDTEFDPNANNLIHSIAVQPDGRILIGGQFTFVGGTARDRFARINYDGTIDTSFNPGVFGVVRSIAVQPDEKILIAGDFILVGAIERNKIARLNSDGDLDNDFNPNVDESVFCVVPQPNGKILIGGDFHTVKGMTRNGIARLDSSGNLEASFDPNANCGVRSIALQPDGKILCGGEFTMVSGVARNYFARLNSKEAAIQKLQADDNIVVRWIRSGAGPEIDPVWFESSPDMTTWTSLADGTRISGGWEVTGLALPFNTNVYIRARGYAKGSMYNASTSIIESVRLLYFECPPVTPTITGDSSGCDSVLLSTESYSSYQWNLEGSPIPGANSQTYEATASGNYTVTVKDSEGCEGMSTVHAVTIYSNPTPNISGSHSDCGSTVLSTESFSSYHWNLNGSPISGANSQTYEATASGYYTVTVTNSYGCEGTSSDFSLTISSCLSLNSEPVFTAGSLNNVSWNTAPKATAYESEVSSDNFGSVLASSGQITATNFTFGSLSHGVDYQYRVRAVYPWGASEWSSTVHSTQDQVAPASAFVDPVPGGLLYGSIYTLTGMASDATSGVSLVEISWDGGATWYQATGTMSWTYDWTLPVDGSYTLFVRATDIVGNIETMHSIPVTVRNRPSPATNVQASDVPYDGGGIIDITWTLSEDDGGGMNYISGYSIYRANSAAGPFQKIAWVLAGITYAQDTTAGVGVSRYYKVRAETDWDVTPNFTDSDIFGPIASTDDSPLPVNNLLADLTLGCNVRLVWIESPSPDILLYNIYYDNGTGTVNYATPLATVSAPATTWVSSALALNTRYIFAVRAKDLSGKEDGLTANQVSIVTECSSGIVRAEIKQPQAGRKIRGERVTILAELIQGTVSQTKNIRMQYRPSGSGSWNDIVPSGSGEVNPDTTSPYSMHWNTTLVSDGNYDLRAVATNQADQSDPDTPYITVKVDNIKANLVESQESGNHTAIFETYRGSGNSNMTAMERDMTQVQLTIPKGSLPVSIGDTTLREEDPAIYGLKPAKGIIKGAQGFFVLSDTLNAAGVYRTVVLPNGISSFSTWADLVIFYRDDNNDGIVDGTTIPALQLDMFRHESGDDWSLQNSNRTVDTTNKFIRVTITQAGTYGLFSYPKPATVNDLKVEPSGNDARIYWPAVTLDDKGNAITVDHYNIYVGTTPDFSPDLIDHTNLLADGAGQVVGLQTYDAGTMLDSQPRYYLVTAVDGTGKESYPR